MNFFSKPFSLIKMTEREYEASVTALNIFFGAILGVSLGNLENTTITDYITLLVITSSCVMSILFVSYSKQKISNFFASAGILAAISFIEYIDDGKLNLPPKLIPTLVVWLLLALSTELWKKMADFE